MSDTFPGLSPRRRRALLNLIDAQVELEDCGALPLTEPSAEERDQAMHGDRLPVQDGGAVLYPIACRRNVLAQQRGEALGGCRWVADDGVPRAVACTTCGKGVAPGMARHAELRSMVDGTYSRGLRVTVQAIDQHGETLGGSDLDLPTRRAIERRCLNGSFFRRDGESTGAYKLAGEVSETVVAQPIAHPVKLVDGGGYLGEVAEPRDTDD